MEGKRVQNSKDLILSRWRPGTRWKRRADERFWILYSESFSCDLSGPYSNHCLIGRSFVFSFSGQLVYSVNLVDLLFIGKYNLIA